MPATTDYWINDRAGDPLLLITAELDASLAKAFPELLREVRAAVGERQVTIVFDRGGWSRKLFRSMIAQGFDILTYRKGKSRRIHERRFMHRRAKLDGRWVGYDLHEQAVRLLKGKLRMRQITRLCDDGEHQTQIITSRWDLRDIEIAHRMFERWRQGVSRERTRLLVGESPTEVKRPGPRSLGGAVARKQDGGALRQHALKGA